MREKLNCYGWLRGSAGRPDSAVIRRCRLGLKTARIHAAASGAAVSSPNMEGFRRLPGGDAVFDSLGQLGVRELDREALPRGAGPPGPAPCRASIASRLPALVSALTPAPDSDRSMMRQFMTRPSASVSRAIGLRGTIRSWRRSSGRLRILRLASQVSCAASLSRLRGVADDRHGKAVVDDAGDLAFDAADMVEIGDDALADGADALREQRKSAGRHVDDLAGKLAPILQHVAAEQVNLDRAESAGALRLPEELIFYARSSSRHPTTAVSGAAKPYGRQG